MDKQLEAARALDELTGGIKNQKIKDMQPGPEKTKLEAEVAKRKEAHEAYKAMVASSCVVSDRVYINSIADRNQKAGKLSIGYGASNDKIGPEYGFGLSIAQKVDGPILLIKTSWGGKSLNYNFRPPSAGEYQLNEKQKKSDKIEEIKQNVSLNYRMMNEHVHSVLNNLKDNHPAYDPKAGFEIAGFVWFQGFNDQFDEAFRTNYKDNMIAFIKDIRKEYKVPNMPFIIGVLGTGMTKEKVDENPVSQGQRAAAQHPEFKDNVLAVESYTEYSHYSYSVFKKGWPAHYHEWDTVGSDRPYHYLGSGAFFVRLGDSFANAMSKLMSKRH
jgi:alpha-galactosidase